MRSFKNLLAVIVVALLLVAVYFAYNWYEEKKVQDVFTRLENAEVPSTYADMSRLFQDFPPLVCKYSDSNFQNSTKQTMLVYKGKVRVEITYIDQGAVVHELLDKTGMYVWRDDINEIYKREPEDRLLEADGFGDDSGGGFLEMFSKRSCQRLLDPDESLFELPVGRQIKPFSDL